MLPLSETLADAPFPHSSQSALFPLLPSNGFGYGPGLRASVDIVRLQAFGFPNEKNKGSGSQSLQSQVPTEGRNRQQAVGLVQDIKKESLAAQ